MILYIIRGLPGSGKSTLGYCLATGHSYAADDYFTDADGKYDFKPQELGAAHAQCQLHVATAMLERTPVIAVCNTFSQKWEAEPYFLLAEKYAYETAVIECQDKFGSIHGVPETAIAAMKQRWEPLR